jgi:3-oxoacyl-[acyl-carrier-protein] synthase-3
VLDIDRRIFLAGTGSYLPDRVVTNEDLADLVSGYDTDESGPFAAWVDRVTHIRERRFLDPDQSAGDMARVACRRAIDAAGLDPAEIDLFIMATFTVKNLYPGEQTMLAHEFGMKGAATFYLTAGCAGSIYGMQIARAFLKAGFARHALVVGTEHLSPVVDFDDPITAVLFGDGAGAAVLSRRDGEGPGGTLSPCVLSSNYVPGNIMMDNTNVAPLARQQTVTGDDGRRRLLAQREFIRMQGGPRVLRTAVNAMAKVAVESLGYTMKDLRNRNEGLRELLDRARIVPHQANGRIIDGLRDKLEISEDRMVKTIYRYGNISCASNLISLDYAIRRGNMFRPGPDDEIVTDETQRIEPGDLVLVPTVGAGYLTGCYSYVHE